MRNLKSELEHSHLDFLIERITGTLEAAEEERKVINAVGSLHTLDEYYDGLLDAYKNLVKAAYPAAFNSCKYKCSLDLLDPYEKSQIKQLLEINQIDHNFVKDYFLSLCDKLCGHFTCRNVLKGYSLDDAMQIESDILFAMRCFKNRLSELEAVVRKAILQPYSKATSVKDSNLLLVNSAERVADVFRNVDVISASVLNLDDPHWYQENSRNVLFVYEPKAEDVLGMFPADSSTHFRDISSIEIALVQLLSDDGLDGSRSLSCNWTDFRPAYHLDTIVNNSDNVSEVLLKRDAKPIGIIVRLRDGSNHDLRDALAYKQMFPDVKIYILQDNELNEVTRVDN